MFALFTNANNTDTTLLATLTHDKDGLPVFTTQSYASIAAALRAVRTAKKYQGVGQGVEGEQFTHAVAQETLTGDMTTFLKAYAPHLLEEPLEVDDTYDMARGLQLLSSVERSTAVKALLKQDVCTVHHIPQDMHLVSPIITYVALMPDNTYEFLEARTIDQAGLAALAIATVSYRHTTIKLCSSTNFNSHSDFTVFSTCEGVDATLYQAMAMRLFLRNVIDRIVYDIENYLETLNGPDYLIQASAYNPATGCIEVELEEVVSSMDIAREKAQKYAQRYASVTIKSRSIREDGTERLSTIAVSYYFTEMQYSPSLDVHFCTSCATVAHKELGLGLLPTSSCIEETCYQCKRAATSRYYYDARLFI